MAKAKVTADALDFTSDGSTSNVKLTGSDAALELSSASSSEVDVTGVGALSCTEIESGTLALAAGSITDTSGTISFGNEHLETTGDMTAGTVQCTEVIPGTLELASGLITDTSGSISFGNENLSTTGTIQAATLTATSDERLKTHIVPLKSDEAQALVGLLQGVRFEWKDAAMREAHGPQIGLLAQDVERAVPEVVVTNEEGIKSVDYAKLVALLVTAVQPLIAAASYGDTPPAV